MFHIDIERCKACGGRVKIIPCIEDPGVIEQILTHLEGKDFWGAYYNHTDGMKLSVEAGRVYALCFAPDLKEKVFRTRVVGNDTDQAVAGRKQRFDTQGSSKYSNLCPA